MQQLKVVQLKLKDSKESLADIKPENEGTGTRGKPPPHTIILMRVLNCAYLGIFFRKDNFSTSDKFCILTIKLYKYVCSVMHTPSTRCYSLI